MITLAGISKYYTIGKKKTHALEDVSLKIENGEFVALIGPSGSGKTTLLHIMGGLDRPSAGEVLFKNKNLNKLSDGELSKFRNQNIGFVFQDPLLLPHLTLYENVIVPFLFAGELPSESEVHSILHEVGLSHLTHHKPHQLSGGQKQRACVARALVMNPALVLADEPTGNLDAKTGKEIIELFKGLHKNHGTAFVVATHDMEIAASAERVINIVNGVMTK
ncbi:MAG: ABC transporter ATP-binding protein [Candidatus Gracilibacteria bacterium]